ncbi:MAG: hypothetical protein A4E55_01088 [Pelotomaculum sp. PtaU1.Bin035]|nr:MAG: hypothetical protein A4E55_01088 [Pelotomaculum sp. PtaU1.Bin035]
MTIQRKLLGRQGEETAAQYLEKNGYSILCKNYRCRFGEIDVVAMDGDILVFVEVRSNSGDQFGLAEESITGRKQGKLRKLAWQYLKKAGKTNCECRFDVIAILFDGESKVKRLEHIENAF